MYFRSSVGASLFGCAVYSLSFERTLTTLPLFYFIYMLVALYSIILTCTPPPPPPPPVPTLHFMQIGGEVYFNGVPRSREVMRRTAYVMQDDVHVTELTVRQNLYFAAQLRLRETMSSIVKRRRVEQILQMLDLAEVADSIVGGEVRRGISGGQLKRLSIAVEIVHLPSLIFLDEPTTGGRVSFPGGYVFCQLLLLIGVNI